MSMVREMGMKGQRTCMVGWFDGGQRQRMMVRNMWGGTSVFLQPAGTKLIWNGELTSWSLQERWIPCVLPAAETNMWFEMVSQQLGVCRRDGSHVFCLLLGLRWFHQGETALPCVVLFRVCCDCCPRKACPMPIHHCWGLVDIVAGGYQFSFLCFALVDYWGLGGGWNACWWCLECLLP